MGEIKYVAHYVSGGVILQRYYTGNDPDQVGTAAFWDEYIKQMIKRLPLPQFWKNRVIKVIHGDSYYLNWLRENGKVGLEDVDLSKPGCQGVAGLFFDKDLEGLHIAVWPRDHKPDGISPHPLTPQQLYDARQTLVHEMGHGLAQWIEYDVNSQRYICRQITKNLDLLMPSWVSPGQGGERLAECYRAWMGADATMGLTSDNRPLKASDYPRAATLLQCSPWLVPHMEGRLIDAFEVSETQCSWDEYEWRRVWWNPFQPVLEKVGRFAVDCRWNKVQI